MERLPREEVPSSNLTSVSSSGKRWSRSVSVRSRQDKLWKHAKNTQKPWLVTTKSRSGCAGTGTNTWGPAPRSPCPPRTTTDTAYHSLPMKASKSPTELNFHLGPYTWWCSWYSQFSHSTRILMTNSTSKSCKDETLCWLCASSSTR